MSVSRTTSEIGVEGMGRHLCGERIGDSDEA